MDQDGPWSVSVAETPYDAHSFSLYIKSECLSFLFPYLLSPSFAPVYPIVLIVEKFICRTFPITCFTRQASLIFHFPSSTNS